MHRLILISCFSVLLAGCTTHNNWHINPSISEPTEEKCNGVIFGNNRCANQEKQAEKNDSNSVINKVTGLDDPLDAISYVGITVGLDW